MLAGKKRLFDFSFFSVGLGRYFKFEEQSWLELFCTKIAGVRDKCLKKLHTQRKFHSKKFQLIFSTKRL